MEEGYEVNDICGRNGCNGVLKQKDLEGSCSCHINPPCGYCETPKEYCPECGWDAQEAIAEIEYENQKHTKPFKLETDQEKKVRLEKRYSLDDGNLYSIHRYFDDIFEGTNGRDMKLGEAYRKLDQLNRMDRYYVSYSLKKQL